LSFRFPAATTTTTSKKYYASNLIFSYSK